MFPEVVQVIPRKDYTVYVYFEDGKIVCAHNSFSDFIDGIAPINP